MIPNSGFQLHPLAAQDITEIWEYIADENIQAAGRVREQILSTIRSIAAFPHQGQLRADLGASTLRFQRVRDYLIAYAPEERPVLVVAVLHGRRSPLVMAAVLRARQ